MLDIKLIRENPDKVKAGMKAKEVDCDAIVDRILELDKQRRDLLGQTEALKAQQNKVSKQIPALKKAGEDTTAIFKEMAGIKEQIAALDGQLRDVVAEYQDNMYSLPNMPDEDLVPGGKENNEPLRYFGEPKQICVQTWVLSIMSAASSWAAMVSGCTKDLVHVLSGP